MVATALAGRWAHSTPGAWGSLHEFTACSYLDILRNFYATNTMLGLSAIHFDH
jgi:hypothetical protein